MTFWINQHLIQTKELIHQWRINRQVKAMATVDHIELASTHIILGLNVGWENLTPEPITIIEIQIVMYKRRQADVLARLLPLERFARQDIVRTLKKTPISQFKLKPHEVHTEHIRFISHQSLNLAPGKYTADIQVRDKNHNSYTRRTKIIAENRMKYHLAEE